MSKITLFVGLALIAVGAFFYLTAETKAVTALIPAFIGLPVAILGAVAAVKSTESVRKHTAHVAVMLTLIGALGGIAMGLKNMGTEGKERAVMAQFIMGAICVAHVVMSVRSFIAARKAREAAGQK